MGEGWQSTALDGVLRRPLAAHPDERGALREVWRASWMAPLGAGTVVQANHSASLAGALRGLHFHLRQTDVWVVLEGRAHVGLADIRALLAGATRAQPPVLSLELGAGDCLLIPIGVAHGLWALTDVSLLYLLSAEYDGSDEHGFAWNDPGAAVRWPAGRPALSERDQAAPSLAEAVRLARGSA